MEFIQLNRSWNAEPNTPELKLEIIDSDIVLTFYMNAFQFREFDVDDLGTLRFYNCFQYRLGSPNDEGFYIFDQDRYKLHGIKWGEFYQIKDSDWLTNFPDAQIINRTLCDQKLNHYLFYFRDETFECIAKDYDFRVSKYCT